MAAIYGTFENLWTKTSSEDTSMFVDFLRTRPLTIKLISGIIITLIGPITAVANGIVIYAIWKDPFKRLRSCPSNFIIASMATCDFLVGVVCATAQAMLFFSIYTKANEIIDVWIPVAVNLGTFLINVSMFHILALTIDRVIAVVDPLRYKSRITKSKTFVCLFTIWLFIIFLTLLGFPLEKNFYIYSITMNLVSHSAIITVILLSLFIIFHVRKQTNNLKRNSALSGNLKAVILRDKKTTKSILMILAVFKVCFMPIFVTQTIVLTCSVCYFHLNILSLIYSTSFVLTHVNSCLNPFLYAFRLPKFRKPVGLIAKRLFRCIYSSKDQNDYIFKITVNVETMTSFETKL